MILCIFVIFLAIRASQLDRDSGIYFEEIPDTYLQKENTITIPILSPINVMVRPGKNQAQTIGMIQVCSEVLSFYQEGVVLIKNAPKVEKLKNLWPAYCFF